MRVVPTARPQPTRTNAFGLTGTGRNVSIWSYRVLPTPDDNCANDNSDDPQCGTDTADIASAIDDAVDADVNVISMSLGGGSCSNGVDGDPTEGAAVANAIAANVVVVRRPGTRASPAWRRQAATPEFSRSVRPRSTTVSRTCPAIPEAPLPRRSSTSPPIPTYGGGDTLHSASDGGIVAPGGDPANDTDNDDLHWILNISTTPYMSSASDETFEGYCGPDYPGLTGVNDCNHADRGHVDGDAARCGACGADPLGGRHVSVTGEDAAVALSDGRQPQRRYIQGCGRLDVYRAMATAL